MYHRKLQVRKNTEAAANHILKATTYKNRALSSRSQRCPGFWMSHAASAYARTSQTTASPREIEAQALLKAARQLQEVQSNWNGADRNLHKALMFNRRLWSIFLTEAEANENPNSLEVRQKIANIGIFVLKQTIEMQMDPHPSKLKSLIDINCNIAAGLSGRAA